MSRPAAAPRERQPKAEVDAAVEEAREALLKNIDEVRTVETGWQLTDMDLSDIAQINDRVSSGAIAAIAAGASSNGGPESSTAPPGSTVTTLPPGSGGNAAITAVNSSQPGRRVGSARS